MHENRYTQFYIHKHKYMHIWRVMKKRLHHATEAAGRSQQPAMHE